MKFEIQQLIQDAIKSAFGIDFEVEKIKVDYPPDGMGDFSTNVALLLAKEVGKLIAKTAAENKITKIVFDRGGTVFHGRVKAVADGAREGGLIF